MRRLSDELVARRLAADEQEATKLVNEGRVTVDNAPALNPSRRLKGSEKVSVAETGLFVSRGGEKLAPILTKLQVDVSGRVCLDAGAGSGGFTDALLAAGAASVVAVDVGYGQFDWRLRNDPRVELLERTNIRTIAPSALGDRAFDIIVGDLSFISLRAVIDVLNKVASPEGEMLLLVKPEFEAPREQVPAGGVVSDPAVWAAAIRSVCDSLAERDWQVLSVELSSIPGAEGNREFFVYTKRGAPVDPDGFIAKAIAEAS